MRCGRVLCGSDTEACGDEQAECDDDGATHAISPIRGRVAGGSATPLTYGGDYSEFRSQMRTALVLTHLVLPITLAACEAPTVPAPLADSGATYFPGATWRTADPASAGFDRGAIDALRRDIDRAHVRQRARGGRRAIRPCGRGALQRLDRRSGAHDAVGDEEHHVAPVRHRCRATSSRRVPHAPGSRCLPAIIPRSRTSTTTNAR